jgi:hypothetical protein
MPCLHCNTPLKRHATLKKTGGRSRKAAASANQEFQEHDLTYSSSSGSVANSGLRALKQVSYPEVCSWSPQKCQAYLLEHGVLSDSMPVCFSCFEPMKKIDRSANGTVACQTSGCYIHPEITWPREAYSPLHGQARQNLGLFSHIFFMFYRMLKIVKGRIYEAKARWKIHETISQCNLAGMWT